MRRVIVFVLSVCLAASFLSACRQVKDPEATVEAFFRAVDERDTAAALRCFTPELRESYQAALRTSAKLFGMDVSMLLSGMAGIPCPGDDMHLNYRIYGKELQDQTHALVYVYVYTDYADTEEYVFSCIRIGRNWYLNEP